MTHVDKALGGLYKVTFAIIIFQKKILLEGFKVYTRYSYDRMLDTISTFITYKRITNLPYLVQPIMHFLNYHTKFEFIDFLFFFFNQKELPIFNNNENHQILFK